MLAFRAMALGAAFLAFNSVTNAALKDGTCSDQQTAAVTTAHTAMIGGKQVAYNATAAFIEVTAADQKSKACIFYTAYTVTSAAQTRPLVFAFNGGPGSASIWLHMGALGPKRIDMGPQGLTVFTPTQMVANTDSLLDVADVVMIDPVATGFSQPEGDAGNDPFFGVKNDYQSIASFIQNYLNLNNRWTSPKYVMGESYGGIRASLLARHLQEDMGISLNGVIFVSPWMSTTTTNFGESDNDLPYMLYLPTYAATAWYHGKIAARFQSMPVDAVFALAKEYAESTYFEAMLQGTDLPNDQFHAVAKALSDFTGLPQQYVENLDLRIADTDYFTGLLNDQNLVVGRFDSRFVGGRLPDQPGSTVSDPSDAATNFAWVEGINDYLRTDLGFHTTSPYAAGVDASVWPFDSDALEYGVLNDLSQAMIYNPNLRVYAATGYYDLAVPMGTTEYNLAHLAPRLNLTKRIQISHFQAGHMVYILPSALDQLKSELAAFITFAK